VYFQGKDGTGCGHVSILLLHDGARAPAGDGVCPNAALHPAAHFKAQHDHVLFPRGPRFQIYRLFREHVLCDVVTRRDERDNEVTYNEPSNYLSPLKK